MACVVAITVIGVMLCVGALGLPGVVEVGGRRGRLLRCVEECNRARIDGFMQE